MEPVAGTVTDLNKNYTKGRSCNYKTFPRSTARKTVALCPKTTYKVQDFLFTFWDSAIFRSRQTFANTANYDFFSGFFVGSLCYGAIRPGQNFLVTDEVLLPFRWLFPGKEHILQWFSHRKVIWCNFMAVGVASANNAHDDWWVLSRVCGVC